MIVIEPNIQHGPKYSDIKLTVPANQVHLFIESIMKVTRPEDK